MNRTELKSVIQQDNFPVRYKRLLWYDSEVLARDAPLRDVVIVRMKQQNMEYLIYLVTQYIAIQEFVLGKQASSCVRQVSTANFK